MTPSFRPRLMHCPANINRTGAGVFPAIRRRIVAAAPAPSCTAVPNAFTGEVNWVEIDVGTAAEDADHRIDPDELLRVAMARQ